MSIVIGLDTMSMDSVITVDAPHTGGIKAGVSPGEVAAPIKYNMLKYPSICTK